MLKKKFLIGVLMVALVSGLSNFLYLRLMNNIIQMVMENRYTAVDISYIVIFTLTLIVTIWSRRELSIRVIYSSQRMFWNYRNEILSITLNANYSEFRKRKFDIQSALVFDVDVLTQASLNIIVFLTSAITTIACLAYMAVLSMPLFLLTLGVSALGVIVYQVGTIGNNKKFTKTREYESKFMFYFNSILNGFKEIKINPSNGNNILKNKINPIANNSYENNTGAFVGFLNNQTIGQVLFYVLIASILLFFSVRLNISSSVTINFLFILMALLAAIEAIMVLLPGLMRAKVSMNRLVNLRKDIVTDINASKEYTVTKEEFDSISLKNISYRYEDANKEVTFEIGPISLHIEKNDVIFIYGGNGSGKTTLVMSLLGLQEPHAGTFYFNGVPVTEETMKKYKSLYSVVFNDFYLFDEFYSVKQLDVDKANAYLQLFEIEEKVSITDNHFSTIELSTGQRKRLALITALLENKPVLVLDEWAADQDPHFRRKFYQEIIPVLKEDGFTIIAITHDDAYYHHADKLYKMEYGQLIDESKSYIKSYA
jgi:putative pyoverdin transport system ATP-binding/permease protein